MIKTDKKNIAGVGVDILEMKRVRDIGDLSRVAELVLSPAEMEEFLHHSVRDFFFASRFAAKEAVIKAYPGELHFHDFEIGKNGKKPSVHFLMKNPATCTLHVSLSHSEEYVAGFAVAVYNKKNGNA